MIQDAIGRTATKLRLSVTDSCNFNCAYCRPQGCGSGTRQQALPEAEILRLASILTAAGIQEIRVTGGEPTLRPDLMKILQGLSVLPLRRLAMTTNGYKLLPLLKPLLSTQCRALNISLDSLRRERFAELTGQDAFEEVQTALLTARDMGFSVKVNTVVLKGINHDELLDFAAFSAKNGIEVRFLEYMQIDNVSFLPGNHFITADDILALLNKEYTFSPIPVPPDSTAKRFVSLSGAKIGLITGESQPFCRACSRLRLSSSGVLLPCLCSDEGVILRDLPEKEVLDRVAQVFRSKPALRPQGHFQPLYQFGG